MKICLSGSMASIEQIEKLASRLSALGHQTTTPCRGHEPHIEQRIRGLPGSEAKSVFVADHLEKIRGSDALLVANFPKDQIEGYIGSSAMMEAAMAYAPNKKLFVLFKPAKEECACDFAALGAVMLLGKLDEIE